LPVVVLSRRSAIAVLSTVIVAPITSTIRGHVGEVGLGVDDGMKGPCAINLDSVTTVRQVDLRRYVSTLRPERMAQVCTALAVATGCTT
jgi:mRNA interferase MazF